MVNENMEPDWSMDGWADAPEGATRKLRGKRHLKPGQGDIYKPGQERVRFSIVGDEVTLRSTAHADIRSE